MMLLCKGLIANSKAIVFANCEEAARKSDFDTIFLHFNSKVKCSH